MSCYCRICGDTGREFGTGRRCSCQPPLVTVDDVTVEKVRALIFDAPKRRKRR